MAEKKVPLGESYNYLKKSMDQIQDQQSGGQPPELYPQTNDSSQPNGGGAQGQPDTQTPADTGQSDSD